MCISCHYKGDNCLVTAEQRVDEHGDGDSRCIRPGRCVDCGQDPEQDVQLVSGRLEHLCARIVAMQVIGSHSTRYAEALRTERHSRTRTGEVDERR